MHTRDVLMCWQLHDPTKTTIAFWKSLSERAPKGFQTLGGRVGVPSLRAGEEEEKEEAGGRKARPVPQPGRGCSAFGCLSLT